MRYLKNFENHSKDITDDIAEDLLPKLQEIKDKRGKFTVEDFDSYMKERGSDSHTTDLVLSNLVNMGFDFDVEEDEDSSEDYELTGKIY